METVVVEPNPKNKILVKGLIIGGLVLLLMIPTFFVRLLIEERQERQQEAVNEVSAKWAGNQNITGPVLIVPYIKTVADTGNKVVNQKHFAYFLPDELDVKTIVQPQERSRGIYKVILYNAKATFSGRFGTPVFEQLKIPAEKVLWQEAYVKMNVADVKGLNEEIQLKWKDSLLTLSPQSLPDPSAEGMAASLPVNSMEELKNISFATTIDLNGSETLLFTPVGKVTNVEVTSTWPHPSFTGNILPQNSQIKDSGFKASWKSMAHKRGFPQFWTSETAYDKINPGAITIEDHMRQNSFGVDLFIPVNGYQKTLRTIKYAALCILLTFASFFLIENVNRKSVHPFQYGLIGLALVLFYVLLLSISEYTGFNLAYGIAAAATVGLIGWFVKGLLDSAKLSTLLSVLLLIVYVYVFTILQLQDFALLLGSIGLFISLAVVMKYSRKIKW